jgi:LPXTG-motif cell wall-anchored protein
MGANNRLHDGNTFTDNTYAFYLSDGWNNSQKTQRWSTITNNTWDGNNTWIMADEWDGSTNVTITKTAINNSGVAWTESGNINRLSAPPTPPPAPAPVDESTTTTSTTVAAPSVVVAAPVATRANALPETGASTSNLQLSLLLLGLASTMLVLRRRLVR